MKARKFLAILLAAVIFAAVPQMVVQASEEARLYEVRVTLHGEEIDFGNDSPVIIGGRTYVPYWFIEQLLGDMPELGIRMIPLRLTLEGSGHIVEWDELTNTANIILAQQQDFSAVALEFMAKLSAGEYIAATMMFTPELLQALPIQLQVLVSGMQGEVLDFSLLASMEYSGFYIATVSAIHAKGTAVHNIVVDGNGNIAGWQTLEFNFEPKQPPTGAVYSAEAVVIGEGGIWALDALLTIPENASAENPVPALILVPGSGSNNMDSSLFANRPFFDIADYLSSNGIAVLRYNERGFSHGLQLVMTFGTNITMQEEYIEDVLLAAELLNADPRISQVFVLGHSLGGIIAPRIAEEAGLSGTIIMASSPRPLHMLWYDQSVQGINDMVNAGMLSQADADIMFAELTAQMEVALNMPNMTEYELQNTMLFGMLPALYEMSVVESLPIPFIERNDTPVLILHGGRDFQTTDVDFQLFLDATEGMAHVTAIRYAGLNHLMMTAYRQYGELVLDIMEYAIAGRVDAQVLRDIVDWILSNAV